MGVISGVCAVVFVMVIAGILFHKILGMFIEGAMSAEQFIFTGAIYLVAAVIILITPSVILKLILAVLVAGAFIFLPHLGQYLNKRETTNYYNEHIERYREAINRDPKNLAARSFLVDSLSKEGRLDEAIDEQTELMRLSPNDTEGAHRLKVLIEDREEKIAGIIVCPHCGFRNHGGRKVCQNCENQLSFSDDLRKRLTEGGKKQIVSTFAVFAGVLTVMVLATSGFSALSRIFIILLVMAIIILTQIMYFYRKSQ